PRRDYDERPFTLPLATLPTAPRLGRVLDCPSGLRARPSLTGCLQRDTKGHAWRDQRQLLRHSVQLHGEGAWQSDMERLGPLPDRHALDRSTAARSVAVLAARAVERYAR